MSLTRVPSSCGLLFSFLATELRGRHGAGRGAGEQAWGGGWAACARAAQVPGLACPLGRRRSGTVRVPFLLQILDQSFLPVFCPPLMLGPREVGQWPSRRPALTGPRGFSTYSPPCWLVTPSELEPRVPMVGLDKDVDIFHFLKGCLRHEGQRTWFFSGDVGGYFDTSNDGLSLQHGARGTRRPPDGSTRGEN